MKNKSKFVSTLALTVLASTVAIPTTADACGCVAEFHHTSINYVDESGKLIAEFHQASAIGRDRTVTVEPEKEINILGKYIVLDVEPVVITVTKGMGDSQVTFLVTKVVEEEEVEEQHAEQPQLEITTVESIPQVETPQVETGTQAIETTEEPAMGVVLETVEVEVTTADTIEVQQPSTTDEVTLTAEELAKELTRGEVFKIIVEHFNFEMTENDNIEYGDLEKESEYAYAVEVLSRLGYVRGDLEGNVFVDKVMTQRHLNIVLKRIGYNADTSNNNAPVTLGELLERLNNLKQIEI